MTTVTAVNISNMPRPVPGVKLSLKTRHPIATAVRGSKAPKMEVSVGPMYLMAFTSVIFEIAVAGSAVRGYSAMFVRLLPIEYRLSDFPL